MNALNFRNIGLLLMSELMGRNRRGKGVERRARQRLREQRVIGSVWVIHFEAI